jgi:hypothetical protein
MKVAHLVLAHKNPAQVKRLLEALDHPSFSFYIHIDAKADIAPFLFLQKKDKVSFIRNRASIHWASFGTIQATINGFQEILPGNFDYINVISGQDFPIKSSQQLFDHLSAHKGDEFITCESVHDEWPEAAVRVEKYYLVNWQVPGKFQLEKIINKVMPKRKFPLPYDIVGRANWFTLTSDAVKYALDFIRDHPGMVRFFKFSWGADELIWATVLYNSKFKPRIRKNLVYVDWTGQTKGHPRTLDLSDLEKLKSSDRMFARKFDMDHDAVIIDRLENHIGVQKTNPAEQHPNVPTI